MCSYLGAETVAVDAAKPRRSVKRFIATGAITPVVLALMAGCSGVSVNVGSNWTTPNSSLHYLVK
jgi:hypothetical protein